MQWSWATSLDDLWRSPSFPMWATLIAAGFGALIVLIVLLRADKTMANGALAVIALLAIGVASTTTVRGFGPPVRTADPAVEMRVATQQVPLAPALACLDGLAGETVEAACEKAVFGAPDTAAAAVSYAAGQVARVVAASSARALTPDLQVLKRAVERDRYGLVAQVITIRDRCVVTECPLFRVLSDPEQIKANMNERLYDTLVTRHSASWNGVSTAAAAPAPASAAAGLLPPAAPTGRPTTVDFATSAAIPPVSIMTPDPATQPQGAAAAAAKSGPVSQPQAAAAAPAAKSGNAASPQATASKSTNAQAQAKRPQPTPSTTTSSGQAQQPAHGTVGRPRVVAPVPYVPSQVGDE